MEFIRLKPQENDYTQVLKLRQDILRIPIGLNLYDEDLDSEVDQVTLVCLMNKEVVACLMLQSVDSDDNALKLRQMAVSPAFQGQNVGKRLVEFAETFAFKEANKNRIVLHARTVSQGFYLKLGYRIVSDEFVEVGVPHVVMEKHLTG